MIATVEVLAGEMAEAYDELKQTLSGLTDPEFAWEPVAGSWRVFRDDEGQWTYDYAIPDPHPAPFTTIGWRLVHIALCKVCTTSGGIRASGADVGLHPDPG